MKNIKILTDALTQWDKRYRSFGDYSVTTLLNPPRMVQLNKRHKNDVVRTPEQQIAAFIGSGVHLMFEESLKLQAVLEPEYSVERTVYDKIEDRLITGKFDILWNERHLYDIKTCFSEDTEILTPSGWKLFKDLDNDLVAQYNIKGEIEFVFPTDFIKSTSDKMYEIKNSRGSYNQFITPDHRVVYSRFNGTIQEKTADKIKPNGRMKFPVSGIKINGENNLSFLERFLIAYQADGCFGKKNNTGKTKGYRKVYFSFKKDRKKERFQWILDNLKLEYKKTESKSRLGFTTWYVQVPINLPKTFEWVNLNTISGIWCREFLIELSNWDCHILSDCTLISYSSKIKLNVDIVQAICALTGYSSKYLLVEKNKENSNWSNSHVLYIRPCYSFTGQQINKNLVEQKQNVYCVSVPSGMIVVRRNNCVCISGNCKTWKKVFDPDMVEWHEQLNIYALMLHNRGLDIRSINIIACYLDWDQKRSFRNEDYPQTRVVEYQLSLWPWEVTDKFLRSRINLMKNCEEVDDGSLPLCTDEEMWVRNKDVDYAVLASANSARALKVCSSFEEATLYAQSSKSVKHGVSFIEIRRPERKRCEQWCDAAPWCQQFKEYASKKEAGNYWERINL